MVSKVTKRAAAVTAVGAAATAMALTFAPRSITEINYSPPAQYPVMTSTFLQPSINASYPTINWTVTQFENEFISEKAVGINTVIVQWTVDQDANETYFTYSGSTLPPQYDNMVGNIMTAASAEGMTVWLGLCNTYNWQADAGNSTWLSNQASLDETAAATLYSLYPSQIAGWYISDEVNDDLLNTPSDIGPMTSFFSGLAAYFHANDGDKPVMESPTYENLALSNTKFAALLAQVMGNMDVLAVQDSGGSGYISAAQIKYWFQALHVQFGNTETQVWQNSDMFSTSGPMASATLQANLQATQGLVNNHTGFSFTTEMDPTVLGTSTYYNAYQTYEQGY